MYELLVLSRLMYGPDHGYRIAKITNDIIGPWAKVSPGTLYPVLARLERAGYIAVVDGEDGAPDGRQSRTYAITPGGRMRFHQLMMDTTSNVGDYQRLLHLKIPYLEFLEPRERAHLLSHYVTYCETAVLYLQSEMQDLLRTAAAGYEISPAHLDAAVDLLLHQAEQWQAEADWAKRVRERAARGASSEETCQAQNERVGPDNGKGGEEG